ncbi:hypothetical protein ABFS83_08G222500 [Erythranthe nasuta]
MKFRGFIFIAAVLVCSVFAEEKFPNEVFEVSHTEIKGGEPKHTNTYIGGGYGGFGGGVGTGGKGGGSGGGTGGGSGGGTGGGSGGGTSDGSGGGVTGGGGSGAGGSGGGGGGGGGGGSGSPGGYSAGYSHGGVYGGGKICKWGCCSESYGYSHKGGGYYGCTCCYTAAQAEAYKQTQAKLAAQNNN